MHVLNSNSSRSHVLFTIHIEMRTSAEADEKAVVSKIHLVDLAGSERTKKTNASGDTEQAIAAKAPELTGLRFTGWIHFC